MDTKAATERGANRPSESKSHEGESQQEKKASVTKDEAGLIPDLSHST